MTMARLVTSCSLHDQVTLQVRHAGTDAHGQEANTWADVATVWASAEPLRGRDFFAASQAQSAVTTRFAIRWRADLTAVNRVLWRGQPYDIEGAPIDVDGRRHTLELMCTTGVRDGR